MLKGEQQMLTRVLEGVSETYSENLMNTISMFRNIFMNEMKIRDSIRKQKITLLYTESYPHISENCSLWIRRH